MNHGPLLFLGVLLTTGASWLGIVFKTHVDLGRQDPVEIQETGERYPTTRPGLARMGEEVYRENGCVHCHTRQVLPNSAGSDIARGWGRRRTVAQDFLQDQPIMPGTLRLGPDLANIGARQTNLTWHLLHLYNPQIVAQGSTMPPSRHLFEIRKIRAGKSKDALDVPPGFAPKGFDSKTHEILPTQQAIALVEYMIRSRAEPYLFEVPPPLKPKKPSAPAGGTNAPPTAASGTNAPVASPAATNSPAR